MSKLFNTACLPIFLFCCNITITQAAEPDPSEKALKIPSQSQSAEEQGVSLKIDCPKTFHSGSENYITIVVSNSSEKTVIFNPNPPQRLGAGFEITRGSMPVNTTIVGGRYLANYDLPSPRPLVRMKPGQEYTIVANVTRYYDLSVVDHAYKIVGTWWGTFEGNQKEIRLQTEPLEFEVKESAGETPLGKFRGQPHF